jgi:endonuclease-3
MKQTDIEPVMNILQQECKKLQLPLISDYVVKEGRNPFKTLISTVLSLRTKDAVTAKATDRLFELADHPKEMMKLSVRDIEKAIYPVGFYITKARRVIEICKKLVDQYQGCVPDDIDELLKFPGVGRKTANLVLTEGYGKLGICVDTHVHKLCNRLGYLKTKTAHETEYALREILPTKYWMTFNTYLVAWGQNICVPISPLCSKCALSDYCDKVAVGRSR